MADQVKIDVEKDFPPTEDVDLQFQDFSDSKLLDDVGDSEMINSAGGASLGGVDDDNDQDDTELLSGQKKMPPFWSFEYYQQFFDVDTSQVGRRLLGSFIPQVSRPYIDSHIRPSPDLYGPFWISATLVFTLAISADMARLYSDYEHKRDPSPHFSWINMAAMGVFLYTWLVPTGLYSMLYWRGVQTGLTFLEMICLYGYSLTLFVPVSLLCVIQIVPLQVVLVGVAMGLSGFVLFSSLWQGLERDDRTAGFLTLTLLVLLHMAFAAGITWFILSAPDWGPTADPAKLVVPVAMTEAPIKSS